MSWRFSRREFFTNLGGAIAASILPGRVFEDHQLLDPSAGLAYFQKSKQQSQRGAPSELLYPPTDLSYFEKPIAPLPSEIEFGYAAITWGGNDRQAIEDIAAVGFRGIQLRSNVLKEFGGKPSALRALLKQHRLTMVALSSGGLSLDRTPSEELAKHTQNAKFVKDVGGTYLQVVDERPENREITREDYKRLGGLLTELGKSISDLGILLGYHNHMNSLGERPEEVDWILEASDPHFAKLELDVAHYVQGGGDPVKAIERFHDRLLFLHIKDVERLPPSATVDRGHSYRFVELGRGQVDLPGVFDALKRVKFRGWAIVELDSVPDQSRTPKESAEISKRYLEEKLGYKI